MTTLTLKAPAKVNLYLHVLEKRPDDFHNIETVFEKIDLCDEITLKRRKQGIRLLCQCQDLPRDERNLGVRAAQLLLAKTNRNAGVEIRIRKRIPLASGLGGGSSDAASVLLGLNKLLSCNLSRKELLQIAKQLGADVSFFLFSASRAIGRGKGEILTSLRWRRKNWYILVVPKAIAISTQKMYQQIRRNTLTKAPFGVKIVLRALEKGDLTALDKTSFNSFEPILVKRYNEIQRIRKALKSLGAGATLISGSGPCVFGIVQTRKEAMDISKKLRAKEKTWQVIVAKTFSNSKKED